MIEQMENNNPIENKALIASIEKLNASIERQTSWQFIVLKGVVYGLATAIGATIIASVAFSWLTATFNLSIEEPSLPTADLTP